MAGGEQAHDRLEGRRRAHGVPHVPLDGVDGNLVRSGSEDSLEHLRLHAVVEPGGGAVSADEVDLRGLHTRLVHRGSHGVLESAPTRVGRRDVRSVAAARVAEQPAEPRGAARVGVALAREQHEGRRLAEQGPAAPAVEGTDGVPGQRAERIEAPHDESAQHVVAAGDHGVSGSLAQELGADTQRRGPRGTRRRHGQHGAAQGEPAREIPRRAVIERPRQRPEPARAGQGALALLDPAERRPEHHGRPGGIGIQRGGARAAQLLRRLDEQARGPAGSLEPQPGVELLDLAAHTDPKVVHREPLDARDPRPAGQERRPEGIEVVADRGHDSGGEDGDRLTHRVGSRRRRS